jgi:hypothetical protein
MPPATPAWTITAQMEQLKPTPDGKVTQGVVITFRTAAGNVGTVFVPDAQYSPAAVAAAVGQRAMAMDQVSSLQG